MRKISLIIGSILALATLAVYAVRAELAEVAHARGIEARAGVDTLEGLDDGLHLALCGSGSPMPDRARMGPCAAVIAGKRLFVIDIGAGASRNFGPMGLSPGRTEAVFLTHFHSDHIGGLGDFLIQRWANSGAAAPLPVFGPEGVEAIVNGFNALYDRDRAYRVLHHGEAAMPSSGYGGRAVSFDLNTDGSKVLLDDGDIKITAFAVNHGAVEPAVGYRFDYKGRAIVISGDTARSASLERFAASADILAHEALHPRMTESMAAAFEKKGDRRLAAVFREIPTIHASPAEAGESARAAGVKMLVLTHIIPPAPQRLLDAPFRRDARQAFDGEIVVGRDGLLFSLPAGAETVKWRRLL